MNVATAVAHRQVLKGRAHAIAAIRSDRPMSMAAIVAAAIGSARALPMATAVWCLPNRVLMSVLVSPADSEGGGALSSVLPDRPPVRVRSVLSTAA